MFVFMVIYFIFILYKLLYVSGVKNVGFVIIIIINRVIRK